LDVVRSLKSKLLKSVLTVLKFSLKDTMICSRIKSIAALALIFFTLCTVPSEVECANNKKSSPSTPTQHEPTIEEVTAKQLERILADKDYVAVYWCKFLLHQSAFSISKKFRFGLLWQDKSEKKFKICLQKAEKRKF
jgi:hypothetical protein